MRHSHPSFSTIKHKLTIELKDDIKLYCDNSNIIYLSDHFLDRAIERDLYKNSGLLKSIIYWFYNNIFTHSTIVDRTYCVMLRDVKIIFLIREDKYFEKYKGLVCIVKTVYDDDRDYQFDESIELKV